MMPRSTLSGGAQRERHSAVSDALKANRARLLASYVFQVLAGILPLVQVYLLTSIVDALVAGVDSISTLFDDIAAMFACGLAGVWSAYLARWLATEASSRIVSMLQVAMFSRLLRMPFPFYTTIRPGAVVSRLTSDVTVAETRYSTVIPTMISSISSIVVSVAIVALVDPRIVAFLVLVPLALVYVRKAESRINTNISKSLDATADLASAAQTFIASDGVLLARQAGRTERESKQFQINSRELARLNVSTAKAGALAVSSYGTAFVVIYAGALCFSVWLIGQQGVTVGSLLLVVLYLQQLQNPVQSLLGTRYPRMRANVAMDRLEKVLNSPEAPDNRIPTRIEKSGSAVLQVGDVRYAYPPTVDYEIDGLSNVGEALAIAGMPLTGFRNDERKASTVSASGSSVLNGVSFRVDRGEMVAVIGPSGSGKSTLARICAGLVSPNEGDVLLNGESIGQYTEPELADRVAYISQETFVLHSTIRENLLYMAPNATDADLHLACQVARLGSVIDGLDQGMDTVIGEKGYRLSGGERQRLAIARAVLRRPQVVVLDEPTANLDNETEAEVWSAVRKAFSNAAVISIAHRLTTVRNAHRILVLARGRIVEEGTPQELELKPSGVYRSMLRLTESRMEREPVGQGREL